jgi:hypothetical protein
MKSGVKEILGKTITGVIAKIARNGLPPRSQVFLVFDDNTYYEFFSYAEICGTSGARLGGMDAALAYMADDHDINFESSINNDYAEEKTKAAIIGDLMDAQEYALEAWAQGFGGEANSAVSEMYQILEVKAKGYIDEGERIALLVRVSKANVLGSQCERATELHHAWEILLRLAAGCRFNPIAAFVEQRLQKQKQSHNAQKD